MWEAETRSGTCPSVKSLYGMGFQGSERSKCKALRSWWRGQMDIHRSKTVPMTTTCKRVHNYVYSIVLNGSINWLWIGGMIHKVRAWEGLIFRLTFRPRMKPDETRVNHEKMTSRFMRVCWKKMGLPLLSQKIASKIWTTMTWAVHDGDVPILLGLRSIRGWRTTVWWRSRSSW